VVAAPRKTGYDYHRRRSQAHDARRRRATKRLVYIHRPILLHGRRDDGTKCPCCESENAGIDRVIRHLDVLFDRVNGTRVIRTEANAAVFDELAKKALRIVCPVRCYAEQLPVLVDRTHKVIGVFGGTQAGKSSVEAEWLFDQMLERGGPGAVFWWVGPDQKQARAVGLGKLVTGERTDRAARPIIPHELIVSWPKHAAQDVPLRLIDGSEVYFKHASETDAANLKSIPVQAIVLDEGCSVRHEVNWDEILSRLTTTGGQVLTASTPVLGNFLKRRVYDVGKTYDEIAAGAETNTAIANLTVFDNVWQSPANVAEYVRSFGTDTLRLRLQAYGEWVAVGTRLWRNFEKSIHVVEGVSRSCEDYGLRNVTAIAGREFFKGTGSPLAEVGGQDFNLHPMNLAVLQVGCPFELSAADPANWVLFVHDLVARDSDIVQWAEWLRDKAGGRHGRALQPDHYRGLAMACDASQGHANKAPQHGDIDPYIREMQRAGFDCRPCGLSNNGKPQNPTIPQRTTLLHRLMADRLQVANGRSYPRLLVHGTYAGELVASLELQTQQDDGTPYKVSNTRSDRISGPVDALAYIAWALVGTLERPRSRLISNSLARTAA
jgi:hypothetical protein